MIQSKFYLFIIFILSICHSALSNENQPPTKTIDSLISRLEISENNERFGILLELSDRVRRNDPDLAMSYVEQAKELLDESEISNDLFQYYKSLSAVKLSQDRYQESISLAEKANQINFLATNPVHEIEILQYIGKAHTKLGENDRAQQAFFKALRVADSLRLDKQVAQITNAIGVVSLEMNDFEFAENQFLLAIEKAKEIGYEPTHMMAISNLAIVYINLNKYEEAEKIILESIDIAKEKGSSFKSFLGASYNNLTIIYTEQKRYEESKEYLKKSLVIAEEMNDPSSIAMRHSNLAEVYANLKNYKLAEQHLAVGLNTAKAIGNKEIYKNGLLVKIDLYEKMGKAQKALDYYRQYSSLNDSLLNEKRIQIVAELEKKYELQKREMEILTLSNDNEFAKKREKTLVQTILFLCLGLIAIGSLFYFLRQSHIKNSIIQDKNLKIASDKIRLLEKGKEIIALESLVKGQENERQRLAKEMHDGLGGLLAISHSKLTNLGGPEVNTNLVLQEARNLIGDAYDQVRQISHNLMPLDLEKFGLIEALTNMIQRIEKQNKVCIDFRTYQFDLLLNNRLGLNIYRIVQEALTNILKSAKAQNILIELIQHEETISLSIEDDGIGFDINAEIPGIGIRNMRNRTELLNGEFSIESRIAVGTTISVVLPYLSDVHILFSESSEISLA